MIVNMMRAFRSLPLFITRPMAKKMMPASPNDEVAQWLNSKKRVSKDFLRTIKSPTGMLNDAPFDILNEITAPSLLIMGDRESGAIVSEEAAREMSRNLPGLEIAHLKGASHDIHRAKFDEYIAVLEDFIKTVYG
jgi:pimeloyl-ACP methyl ester carboxylesterase